jgi:hypothetical protein
MSTWIKCRKKLVHFDALGIEVLWYECLSDIGAIPENFKTFIFLEMQELLLGVKNFVALGLGTALPSFFLKTKYRSLNNYWLCCGIIVGVGTF